MTNNLKAVHDDDLTGVLESLGIFGKFQAGLLTCAFCKSTIMAENLYSIFADSGAIKLTCSSPDCIRLLMERIEGKNYG